MLDIERANRVAGLWIIIQTGKDAWGYVESYTSEQARMVAEFEAEWDASPMAKEHGTIEQIATAIAEFNQS